MKKYDFGRTAEPLEKRIRRNVEIDYNGCWIWKLDNLNKWGYARMLVGSRRDDSRRTRFAHRVSYETFVGPIPEGLTIDHLCKVRCCVNPEHLEPVTMTENNRRKRKEECSKCGEKRTERYGRPVCLGCYRAYHRNRYHIKKAQQRKEHV